MKKKIYKLALEIDSRIVSVHETESRQQHARNYQKLYLYATQQGDPWAIYEIVPSKMHEVKTLNLIN